MVLNEENGKLKTIKEEPTEEKREELGEQLSKAAKNAMEENNFEELGRIVKEAKVQKVTINANIKNK